MALQTILRQSNLPEGEDKRMPYATIWYYSTIESDELIRCMVENSQVSEGDMRKVVAGLVDQFATFLATGHKVKIDGLGTFALRMKGTVSKDKDGKYRLADAKVRGISYTPDKSVWRRMGDVSFMQPEIDLTNPRRLTEEQAAAMAEAMLAERPFFTRAQFAERAGVSRSTAARLLAKLVEAGVLALTGTRNHRLYVAP